MNPFDRNLAQDLLTNVAEVFGQRPTWVVFFREVLGAGGMARSVFATDAAWKLFEQSAEYREIQRMLAELRANDADLPGGPREPQRVITVRLPKSLHEALRAESHKRLTSINRLCIAKLLQPIDDELVGVQGGRS